MKLRSVIVVGAALLMMAHSVFAGGASAPISTLELKRAIGVNGKATLIFFQNPNGGPCRMQKEVLDQLFKARKGNFTIAAVSTMNQEDQRAFYDYGIRSLPSLVLVDKNGKIARVFPPGIQSGETVTAALDVLK